MKPLSPFRNIAICGVGLIGGSLGLGLKKYTKGCIITGLGRNISRLRKAKNLGAIDRFTLSLSQGVENQDLIILSQPIDIIKKTLPEAGRFLKPGTVVMDVGGTKASICREAQKNLPARVHFIGTHPLAGSEKTGIESASPDLFQKAKCLIIKEGEEDREAFKKVSLIYVILGGTIIPLSSREHDEFMAAMSHLPHLVAQALVSAVAKGRPKALKFAASGFRDTTRIAQSSAELWRDIFIDNKKNILRSLSLYEKELKKIRLYLNKGQKSKLTAYLFKVSRIREKI